jgi:thiol-disulfide isomerase/thioredoxin
MAAGEAPEAPPSDPSPAAPTLSVIDETRFAEVLKEHRGQVVLVDFWATWCVECLELMPHTVELHKELGDQGLRVVLVSLDSPEDRKERVEELLSSSGVTFDTHISRYGGDPKSAEAFEIENAALPNIKLYDRTGKLRKVFSAGRMPPEPFDAEDVEKAVRDLLAEK